MTLELDLPRKFSLGVKAARLYLDEAVMLSGKRGGKPYTVKLDNMQVWLLENNMLLIVPKEAQVPAEESGKKRSRRKQNEGT